MELKADYLFEASWEVCNKVGGIYTVMTSKLAQIQDYYNQNYYVIGPYFPKKAAGEFQELLAPDFLRGVFEKLKAEGIACHYGKWLIDGEPNAILIDFSTYTREKDRIKKELWDCFKIDSLYTEYYSFDEPVIWAYAVGRLLEEIVAALKDKKIVAHFHEWLAGAALLYLKSHNVNIATVFTTHATVLGRTIASSNQDLYSVMNQVDPDQEAYKCGVQAKHQTEKQSSHNANVFTTVSEITGIEAERLLNKKPDLLLPNGLDAKKFPTFEEISIKHQHFKRRIKEFLIYYFFPYYTFDLDNTLIYFLAGRYEFRDKGVDIFIKALGRLNERLKKEKSEKNIVTFFWIPGNIRGIKPELLESETFYEDIRESIKDSIAEIQERMISAIISGKKCDEKFLLGDELLFELKKKVLRLKRAGIPPLSTHDLHDEATDAILTHLIANNLLNKKEDRVKVVFYPIYLTGADHLLDLTYYESMEGSQLGLFPSYYEPWGYTSLEAGALGISSVTTDLAGFGRYIEKQLNQTKNPGIFVLKRMNRSEEQVINDLVDIMYYYSTLSKEGRIKNKIEAKRLSTLADWESLIKNYIEAHNLAIMRKYK